MGLTSVRKCTPRCLGTRNLATSMLRPCQINTGEDIITVTKTLVSSMLQKFWSGPRHRHNRSVNVQRLSHGCCDMLKGGVREAGRILLHVWGEPGCLCHWPYRPGGYAPAF